MGSLKYTAKDWRIKYVSAFIGALNRNQQCYSREWPITSDVISFHTDGSRLPDAGVRIAC